MARGEGGDQSEMTGWHTRKHNGTSVAFCGVLDGVGLAWAGAVLKGRHQQGVPHARMLQTAAGLKKKAGIIRGLAKTVR